MQQQSRISWVDIEEGPDHNEYNGRIVQAHWNTPQTYSTIHFIYNQNNRKQWL